jgi:plasmid stabilization system protein ParE
MDQGFVLHPGAAQDLTEIWEFTAKESPLAGRRVREEILGSILNLVRLPNQGHRRTDLTARPLRFTSFHDYLVAYAPEETPLVVIAVFHSRRNPNTVAAILRGRV